ncbi:MAG: acyl-CoA thioesterase [Planctomycetes bacterium]|nr:acyl-CoA thioesterase [Planctomycetota bacterium]
MTATNPHHSFRFHVRFYECDGMGVVHHSNYFRYFEMGRTELMRSLGLSYREVERAGHGVVVTSGELRCKAPARFDDELEIQTTLGAMSGARCRFSYRVLRPADGALIAEGATDHGSVDSHGRAARMPDTMVEVARRLRLPLRRA